MPTTHADCPVCQASGSQPCHALDYRTLPSHHAQRVVQDTEATPLHDQLAEAAEARSLLTRLATDMTLASNRG